MFREDDKMKATFRFVRQVGDGYFGRLSYKETVVDVDVRDVQQAAHKAFATVRANGNGMHMPGAILSRVYVMINDVPYQFYVPTQGRAVEELNTQVTYDV